MYPDNIKPLRVLGERDGDEGAGLVRVVVTLGEAGQELGVLVTGVVPVQTEVRPLHEDVGHKLEWLQ